MQQFNTKNKLNKNKLTCEHIFNQRTFHFSDLNMVHEMPLRHKGTYAPPQDKQGGQTSMMATRSLTPNDQNKPCNHELNITKPLRYVMIIKRHLLTREPTTSIFKNIAFSHGYQT
jgi:hypothetical protein